MPTDPKRMKLFKALLRFGGDPEVPMMAEAAVMPNSPMEQGIGYEFGSPNNDENSSGENNFYSTQKRKMLKLQKMQRR